MFPNPARTKLAAVVMTITLLAHNAKAGLAENWRQCVVIEHPPVSIVGKLWLTDGRVIACKDYTLFFAKRADFHSRKILLRCAVSTWDTNEYKVS